MSVQKTVKTEKEMRAMNKRIIQQPLRMIAVVTLIGAAGVSAFLALPLSAIGDPPPEPPVIDDTAMHVLSRTVGGAQVSETTRTVTHWFGSTLDPNNGITYGYNMVGADPNNCSGSGCDVTVTVDIIPLNVVAGGESFDGSDIVNAVLASPVFALNDYGFTPFATAAGNFPNPPAFIRGPSGILSQDDTGYQLQLLDATMRAHFNKTGSNSYHLRLNPVVHDPISIIVANGIGRVLQTSRGVHFADVNIEWWTAQIQQFDVSLDYIDPTHVALYLTKDVLLYCPQDPFSICSGGFHAANEAPAAGRQHNGHGNHPVQTFAWASYLSPGLFAQPDGGGGWALQDIYVVSHEISEWAHDPFINNTVEPWLFPRSREVQLCSDLLETADPVVNIGFAVGTNTYLQGPNPDGSQSADGYYHPTDDVFLAWFMRLAPNTVSEPTQSSSTNIGRYTFMGDLNPLPDFRQPATDCQ
jgi:hypothetical protein